MGCCLICRFQCTDRYPTNSYLFSGFYQQLMTHIYNMTATITPLGKTLTSNTIPIENHASIS